MSRRAERYGGLRHATAAGLPRGGPARLRQAARVAAVRARLGDALGRHLAGLREEPERVVLLLSGDGWERGLAPHLAELAGAVARVLEAPLRPLAIESVPSAAGEPECGRLVPGGEGPPAGAIDPTERQRRLEQAAGRLMARRSGRTDGGPARSSVDRGPGGQ